tara:strand:+ start:74 stop:1372 length:1299 start_codon:yes stop_codon:yes gene_type:complete
MVDFKIYKLDPDGALYKGLLSMGSEIIQIKNDFQKQAQGASLPAIKDPALDDALNTLKNQKTQSLGLDHTVIAVTNDNPQSYPRAYEHKPVIYGTSYATKSADGGAMKKHLDLYLYAPIGYDGDHFVPDGARLIDDEKECEAVGGRLFAGGWSDPLTFFNRSPVGVAVPDDYIAFEVGEPPHRGSHAKLCFLVQGETAEIVDDYKDRMALYDQKTDDVMHRVKSIVENDLRSIIMPKIKGDSGYYVNMSLNDQGMQISVRRNGANEFMMAGQPIDLDDNDFFTVSAAAHSHEYNISPNLKTKQGRELADAFAAIPLRPSLSDYDMLLADFPIEEKQFDAMFGINGHVPMLREIQGHDILVYNTDDTAVNGFCPQGSLQLPPSIFFWLDDDRADRQMDISPPPAPNALMDELRDLASQSDKGFDPDHALSFEP